MRRLWRRLRRLLPVAAQLRFEFRPPDLERVEFEHGVVFDVEPLLAHMIREERNASAVRLGTSQAARDAALAAVAEVHQTSAVAVEAARREAAAEQARAARLERQLCEAARENGVLRGERDTSRAERDAFQAAFTGERDHRNAAEALRDMKPAGRA